MFHVVGRLQPGISMARVETELDAVTRQLEQEYADPQRNRPGQRVQLVPGGRIVPVRPQDLPRLTAFPIVLVGLVLLLACSNVANMMLARAAGRRREIAVRLALGASRARLVRQLLTESMLIAVGAGVLGLTLTLWILRWSAQLKMPLPIPVNVEITPRRTRPFLRPDPDPVDRTCLRPGARPASHPAGSHSGPQGGRRRKHPPLPRPQPAQCVWCWRRFPPR